MQKKGFGCSEEETSPRHRTGVLLNLIDRKTIIIQWKTFSSKLKRTTGLQEWHPEHCRSWNKIHHLQNSCFHMSLTILFRIIIEITGRNKCETFRIVRLYIVKKRNELVRKKMVLKSLWLPPCHSWELICFAV